MEGKKLWYVANAYVGHEEKVKDYLESKTTRHYYSQITC